MRFPKNQQRRVKLHYPSEPLSMPCYSPILALLKKPLLDEYLPDKHILVILLIIFNVRLKIHESVSGCHAVPLCINVAHVMESPIVETIPLMENPMSNSTWLS